MKSTSKKVSPPLQEDTSNAGLLEYQEIEGKYKFYVLGWMSEAPGYYYPTMVREFYTNYIATLEEPYKNLHAHMDNIEAGVNDRLKDVTVPNLARFAVEMKKAQEDILKLQ
ncbi:hypothetical protein HAX54_029842 [Datura stramonium]|uniref:Uncharacterized protein n=1 Tax=Datura stramonium TaxID=4076 RepID=A0ABS8V8Q6_DATST|nr:hypothetical protein [Datura stramonium]